MPKKSCSLVLKFLLILPKRLAPSVTLPPSLDNSFEFCATVSANIPNGISALAAALAILNMLFENPAPDSDKFLKLSTSPSANPTKFPNGPPTSGIAPARSLILLPVNSNVSPKSYAEPSKSPAKPSNPLVAFLNPLPKSSTNVVVSAILLLNSPVSFLAFFISGPTPPAPPPAPAPAPPPEPPPRPLFNALRISLSVSSCAAFLAITLPTPGMSTCTAIN